MKNVVNRMEQQDRLFNFRPMLFAAFFLVLGIAFAYFRLQKDISYAWLFCALPFLVAALAFSRSWRSFGQRALVCVLLVCISCVGFFGLYLQLRRYADCTNYEGEVIVTGSVGKRKIGEYTSRVELSSFTVDGNKEKGVLNVYLPTVQAEELRIADTLVLRGKITTSTVVIGKYGFQADAVHRKVRYTLEAEECSRVGRSNRPSLLLRSRMERVLYAGMDESSAALTFGLLTGDMSGVEQELVENMRNGGISHLFAVSGLNVGAVFAFCLLLFSKTGLKKAPKLVRFVLLCVALLFYASVCGFSASVMRATLLCLVGYFLKLSCMGMDMLNALGVTGICLLLLSPCQLFDVGFQLSFLACFGLVLLTKPIGQVLDKGYFWCKKPFKRRYTAEEEKALERGDTLPPTVGEKVWGFFRSLLSATLAAQIITLPLLLIHFDFVSGWSLLLNFIFVPIIDGIFTLLLVLTLLACCLPVKLAVVLLYIPSVLWSLMMLVFEVADFSKFALTGIRMSGGACICYYTGITFLSDKWNVHRWLRSGLAMGFFVSFLLLTLFAN